MKEAVRIFLSGPIALIPCLLFMAAIIYFDLRIHPVFTLLILLSLLFVGSRLMFFWDKLFWPVRRTDVVRFSEEEPLDNQYDHPPSIR